MVKRVRFNWVLDGKNFEYTCKYLKMGRIRQKKNIQLSEYCESYQQSAVNTDLQYNELGCSLVWL